MASLHRIRDRLRSSIPRERVMEVEDTDTGALLDEEFLHQIERAALPSLGALTDGLAGIHPGQRRTQAIEFSDYRRYTPGDDLRLIDWKAYARLGELFVKTSLAQESLTLTMLLDCSRSMDSGHPNKLRYARRLAAALGAVGLVRHDSVQLCAFADGLVSISPPLRGRHALQDLLDCLDNVRGTGTTSLRNAVAEYRRTLPHQGVVTLLSDLLVPTEEHEALAALDGAGVSASVLHLVDRAESAPRARGTMELCDRETGESIALTITPALLQRYLELLESRSRALAGYCATHGVRYLPITTTVPPTDLVLKALLHARVEA